jgi:hypothetical protein
MSNKYVDDADSQAGLALIVQRRRRSPFDESRHVHWGIESLIDDCTWLISSLFVMIVAVLRTPSFVWQLAFGVTDIQPFSIV